MPIPLRAFSPPITHRLRGPTIKAVRFAHFFEPNAPNTSERERLREVCGYLPLFTACRELNATFCLPRDCAAQC